MLILIQARILLCGIQKNVFKFCKTYTFGFKILQLTSFIWRSFQYHNQIRHLTCRILWPPLAPSDVYEWNTEQLQYLLVAAVLGRLPGTTVYRNVLQYPDAFIYHGIVILRIDSPIYFANINFIKERYCYSVIVLSPSPLNNSRKPYIQARILLCKIPKMSQNLASTLHLRYWRFFK